MLKYTTQKLGDICRIEKGRTGIASAAPGEYPLVVTAEERKTCNTYQFDCEAVCIPLVSSSGHGKKSLKNVHYQSGKFALGSILCAVIPKNPQEVNARYLHQYLQFYKDTLLVPLMKGAANVSLSMRDIANVEIPLPDFKAQTELAEMFAAMQAKQKELNAEFEKQTEYAKRLRQNILQEAIEGKLTAEWRKQNPVVKGNPDFDAQALFEQIQKDRLVYWKQNPSKESKNKDLLPIDEFETSFPKTWKKTCLIELFDFVDYRGITPKKLEEGITLITAANIKEGFLDFTSKDFISESEYEIRNARGITEKDDILFTTEAPMGHCSLNTLEKTSCGQRIITMKKYSSVNKKIFNKYFCFYILSKVFQNLLLQKATGVTAKGIKASILKILPVFLPPLAEQKEIVDKVESLLAKVTELENQIQERKKLSGKLMQTVLKNAFVPQE